MKMYFLEFLYNLVSKMRTVLYMALFLLCVIMSLWCSAQDNPSWWTSRNVMDTNAPINDNAPVTIGQLKWTATNACAELEANLSGGVGTNVENLVQGFSNTDNWQTVNVGQLKAVAKPFYDRLIEEGFTNAYPWTTNTTADDADFALANIGQLKNLFSFDLIADSDSDSLFDWWEIHWFGSVTNQSSAGDADSDDIANLEEYLRGTDPTDANSRNATLYANYTTGSDTNDGFSASCNGTHGPKKTIGACVTAAIDGDAIQVAGGTYLELPETFDVKARNLEINYSGSIIIR